MRRWIELFGSPSPQGSARGKQRHWDPAAVAHSRAVLDEECTSPSDKARLLASRDPRGGDWLQALPISSCGLRVDDDSFRIAVSLPLGLQDLQSAHMPMWHAGERVGHSRTLLCLQRRQAGAARYAERHSLPGLGQLRRSFSQGAKRVDVQRWQKTRRCHHDTVGLR